MPNIGYIIRFVAKQLLTTGYSGDNIHYISWTLRHELWTGWTRKLAIHYVITNLVFFPPTCSRK